MHHVGQIIKQRREEMHMTQEELAHAVGYKSRASINKIELQRDVPIKKLIPIANVLGIDMHVLVTGSEASRFSHVDTGAMADLIVNPSYKEIIDDIVKLDPSEMAQVRDYIAFLLSKKRG